MSGQVRAGRAGLCSGLWLPLFDDLANQLARPRPPIPFSLAEPATAGAILTAAGFADVEFTGVHEPVYYGPDAASALRVPLATHQSSGGVFFGSRVWLITARCPSPHAQSRTGINYAHAIGVPRSRPGRQPHATADRWRVRRT
jgi:hypothetical protein